MIYARRSPIWVYKALLHPVLSKIANYSVFYFRRFVLLESVEKAMREHYPDYAKKQRRLAKKKTLVNIVVVNKNRQKYTETFINLKIKGLKEHFYVHQFYGGYFPNSEVNTGHLLSNSAITRNFISWWELFWNKGEGYYLKRKFRRYLRENGIKVVLAEFGTCGVEIFEDCKKAGVPLIVTFRGYDIHHEQFFLQNKDRYKAMFEYSAKIVCVSNDILTKINELYGLGDKLYYLPSPIDLEIFKYGDHSHNEPIFLYVGRFTETKSPHLVILSFAEVLKEIPDAKLVMVGCDGGGELFEACLILVKALSIADKVDFKGVLEPIQVYKEMQKARVFVQHSLTTPLNGDREGTPVSVREAMASGLPVVATRHAGIEETITHGKTGILVDEYDYLKMAKEMAWVCRNDDIVGLLGRSGSETVRENKLVVNNSIFLRNLIERYRLS